MWALQSFLAIEYPANLYFHVTKYEWFLLFSSALFYKMNVNKWPSILKLLLFLAKLQNKGPLFTIYQTSWLVCSPLPR